MINDAEFEILRKGRKLKTLESDYFKHLRDQYDLKQVEIEVIFYLEKFPNAASRQIAEDLQFKKGHVSAAKEGLLEKGFIVSVKDESDRRSEKLELTDDGQHLCNELNSRRQVLHDKLFRNFTEDEFKTLSALLQKMASNID